MTQNNVIPFTPNLNFNDALPYTSESRIEKEAVRIWCDVVFGYLGEGFVPLRGFKEKGGTDAPNDLRWVRNDAYLTDAVASFCEDADRRNAAAFIIPGLVAAQWQAGYEHIIETGAIPVDVDTGDVNAVLDYMKAALGQPISLIVNSGGIVDANGQEKAHAYLRLTEGASGDDIKKVERIRILLAQKLGTDPAMGKGKLAQPLRIAGSRHHKYGGDRPVTIREYNPNSEFDINELLEAVEAMAPMPGVVTHATAPTDIFSMDFNQAAPQDGRPMADTLTSKVYEGATSGHTRYDEITRTIGYWVRRHHDGLIPFETMVEEIRAYNTANVVPPWPEDRLEREAKAIFDKHVKENGAAVPYRAPETSDLESYSLEELLNLPPAMPDDLIEPRFLTPRGMCVIGGAPKVGKTSFVTNLLVHAAAGVPFLGLGSPKPLKIFYAQAELDKEYLKERLQSLNLPRDAAQRAGRNLFVTPRFRGILDDRGLARTVAAIKARFGDAGPDVIAIDPLRNVFDGGEAGSSENDAQAMMFFLQERVEALRDATNPSAGIILIHHTRKLGKKALEEDPMQALAGSGALRAYYTTGCVIWKPEETRDERRIHFELRNGPGISQKKLTMQGSQWVEDSSPDTRIADQSRYDKWKAQADAQSQFLVEEIYRRAAVGEVFTKSGFATTYGMEFGLGSPKSIERRVDELMAKGVIKFFDGAQVGKPKPGRAPGYLCVQGMHWGPANTETVDPDTGEVLGRKLYILPTHYRDRGTGATLPVEDPETWIIHDDEA